MIFMKRVISLNNDGHVINFFLFIIIIIIILKPPLMLMYLTYRKKLFAFDIFRFLFEMAEELEGKA